MARKTPEGRFKEGFYADLQKLFPGCVILNNDSQLQQGIPDTIVLWHEHYAMLEFKKGRFAVQQPNQAYYVEMFDDWSFGAFVYPENKEVVLRALQSAFGTRR